MYSVGPLYMLIGKKAAIEAFSDRMCVCIYLWLSKHIDPVASAIA